MRDLQDRILKDVSRNDHQECHQALTTLKRAGQNQRRHQVVGPPTWPVAEGWGLAVVNPIKLWLVACDNKVRRKKESLRHAWITTKNQASKLGRKGKTLAGRDHAERSFADNEYSDSQPSHSMALA